MRTEQIVLCKKTIVAIKSQRATTRISQISPHAFVARQLIAGVNNAGKLHCGHFYHWSSSNRSIFLSLLSQGGYDTLSDCLQPLGKPAYFCCFYHNSSTTAAQPFCPLEPRGCPAGLFCEHTKTCFAGRAMSRLPQEAVNGC